MKTLKTLITVAILFIIPVAIWSQNVGIGTTAPNSKLTVVDSVPNSINIKTIDNNKSTGISFQNSGGNYAWNLFRKLNGVNTSDFIISGGEIENDINSLVERFKITKDGNTEIYGETTLSGKLTNNGSSVFNEDALDKDFRIEGQTKDNLFFVDASQDKIGINTSNPSADLDVVGTTVLNGDLTTFSGKAVFNEGGDDQDFRIKGENFPYLFNVDAENKNIGIGTPSPSARLHVLGTTKLNGDLTLINGKAVFNEEGDDQDFRIESENKPFKFFVDANNDKIEIDGDFTMQHGTITNNWPIQIESFGKYVGIRNIDGKLEMSSNLALGPGGGFARLDNSGGWSAVSDRRLKKNIVEANDLLAKTLQLNPVNYVFKSDENEENQLGFIAQDVQKVFPEFVIEGDLLTLNYSGLSVVAIGAIKEINEKNIVLEDRIAALEAAYSKLVSQVSEFDDLKDQIKREILAEMTNISADSIETAIKE